MKEHSVQYNEQIEKHNLPLAQELPAPMVERAFRLLDLLSTSQDGLTLSDLARVLMMSKSSVHGLLKTLESCGAVEQTEERHFVLGPRLYDLAQQYIQRSGLRYFALRAMHRLAASTGETVCLGKVEQKGVRIIECVVADEENVGLHIAARRGMRIPLLAGATGKCVLANWPLPQRENYLRTHSLTRFTEHSLTDPARLLAHVADVEHTGVSLDYEEYLDGVNAVAAPIYGVGGSLVALLWIVGFATRFRDDVLERATRALHEEALAVSRDLGARV